MALLASFNPSVNILHPVLVEGVLRGWGDEELRALALDVLRKGGQEDEAQAERCVASAHDDARKHDPVAGLPLLLKRAGNLKGAQIAERLFPEGEKEGQAVALPIFTCSDPQSREFPPQFPVVPDLIHEGLTLLVAPPKSGKSL